MKTCWSRSAEVEGSQTEDDRGKLKATEWEVKGSQVMTLKHSRLRSKAAKSQESTWRPSRGKSNVVKSNWKVFEKWIYIRQGVAQRMSRVNLKLVGCGVLKKQFRQLKWICRMSVYHRWVWGSGKLLRIFSKMSTNWSSILLRKMRTNSFGASPRDDSSKEYHDKFSWMNFAMTKLLWVTHWPKWTACESHQRKKGANICESAENKTKTFKTDYDEEINPIRGFGAGLAITSEPMLWLLHYGSWEFRHLPIQWMHRPRWFTFNAKRLLDQRTEFLHSKKFKVTRVASLWVICEWKWVMMWIHKWVNERLSCSQK